MENKDLVTGTPINPKAIKDIPVWFNKNIEIFKIVQRAMMMILTVGVLIAMCYVGGEIGELKSEIRVISGITENALVVVESTRQDINRQIEEIQKDGLTLHFRLW